MPPEGVQPPAFASEPQVLNAALTTADRAPRSMPLHATQCLAWLR